MKFVTDKHGREFLVRKILFLRYGTETPMLSAKPILSMGSVADLLKLPHEKVKWMVRHHFVKKKEREMARESIQPPKLNPSRLHRSERVTLATVKADE